MKKWIAFAGVAILLVIGLLVQPESEGPVISMEGVDEVPIAQESESTEPTMAELWIATASGDLGMRMEPFFSQMPDDLASAQWSERALGDRVHTMTWADGSVVITHWKPSDVSGNGLRLDFIEKVGK